LIRSSPEAVTPVTPVVRDTYPALLTSFTLVVSKGVKCSTHSLRVAAIGVGFGKVLPGKSASFKGLLDILHYLAYIANIKNFATTWSIGTGPTVRGL